MSRNIFTSNKGRFFKPKIRKNGKKSQSNSYFNNKKKESFLLDDLKNTNFESTASFRYNNTKYFWYLDGYLYMPNIDWDAIKLEGVFDDDLGDFLCEEEEKCVPRYLQEIYIPEALFAEIETQVVNAMMITVKLPVEDGDNKINIQR